MRYKLLFLLFFILALSWIVSGYSEVVKETLITMTVDRFDKEGAWTIKFSRNRPRNWDDNSDKPYEDSATWIKWLNVSKYNAEEILPHSIFQSKGLRENDKGILALKANFTIEGYNWAVIEPSNIRLSENNAASRVVIATSVGDKGLYKGKRYVEGRDPNFIWMPSGKVNVAYVYVWSNNYDYNLEAHFKDNTGRVLIVPVSSLKYKGWRNLKILIPYTTDASQFGYPLQFLRFKVNADPSVGARPIYLYFDYFHAIVDTYEEEFFGQDLQYVGKYWGKDAGKSKK